jgi:hypothetical protein
MARDISDQRDAILDTLPVVSKIRRLRRKLAEARAERDEARRERDEARWHAGLAPAHPAGGAGTAPVVVYGAIRRAGLLLDLYRIGKGSVHLVDKNPWRWGQQLGQHNICEPRAADFAAHANVVIADEPEGFSYDNAFFQLQKLGVGADRCATIYQPGLIHQWLCPVSGLQKSDLFGLAHRAIYHDTFERAHFAYGLMLAAEAARRGGIGRISILELGVWAGDGLRNLPDLRLHHPDARHGVQHLRLRYR